MALKFLSKSFDVTTRSACTGFKVNLFSGTSKGEKLYPTLEYNGIFLTHKTCYMAARYEVYLRSLVVAQSLVTRSYITLLAIAFSADVHTLLIKPSLTFTTLRLVARFIQPHSSFILCGATTDCLTLVFWPIRSQGINDQQQLRNCTTLK